MHHNGAIVQVAILRLCADRGKLLETDAVCISALGYRPPEEFENESEDRSGEASFGAATMKVFKALTGTQK